MVIDAIILFLLGFGILFPFFIASIIWFIWSKNKFRVEKIHGKQQIIHKKLKRLLFKEEAPFGEIRYPIMFLTISSIVFIIITMGFGAGINMQTGEPVFYIDWDQYFDEEGRYDPWVVRPMDRWMQHNSELIFLIMYGGYCSITIVLIYLWFEYCKWKWNRIPIEKKTIIKYERIKLPDNKLYIVELLGRKRK